jgi:predicted transcriptional regulator
MKLSNNRLKILRCIAWSQEQLINADARYIRAKTKIKPMILMKEIRALINLRWIITHGNGYYWITEAGEDILIQFKKEKIQNGENQELFK